MVDTEGELEEPARLEDYLKVVKERAWIIVTLTVLGVLAAFLYSYLTTPLYRGTASLVYEKSNLDTAFLGTQLFTTESDRARTLETAVATITREPTIAETVKSQLGLQQSLEELRKMVEASAARSADVITIEAVSPDAAQAADIANAFAEQFITYRQNEARQAVATAREVVKEQLDGLGSDMLDSSYGLMLQEKYETLRIIESMQTGGFSVLSRATVPEAPFRPRTAQNIGLGLLVGLIVGLGVAFVVDYLDKRIKDEKTLEAELGVPVLAAVPGVNGRRRVGRKGERTSEVIGFSTHHSLLEPFRTLRSNLQYFSVGNKHPVWLITSAGPNEGKTVTTINLALSFALAGKRVIVVEADLRRPMAQKYLGLEGKAGLSDVLAGTQRLTDVLQLVRADEHLPPEGRRQPGGADPRLLQRNIYVLTSGPLPPNPAELLASRRMAEVMKDLAEMADCILVDTPPVLLVSDALALIQYADGVIVTAVLDVTTRDEVAEVRSIFERAGARVIGAVAGGKKHSRGYHKRGYGGDYYSYGYGYGPERPKERGGGEAAG
ncbi:MAG: hypothetical protein LLG45_03710 [Actinomycetia bacterium]|nr:hypothetical protein [Actinomycetes bacterium]